MTATLAKMATQFEPLPMESIGERPLVSILMANYNYAGYIGESIGSVLSQSYAHWELIICDDGSSDESVSVIERYSRDDDRIQLICQTNGGHTAALNTAFSMCQGQVVMFLDSDDLFLPNKLSSVVEAFAANRSFGAVIHRVIRVDADRARTGVWPMADLPDGWLGPELLQAGGILPYAPPTSGISLRREVAQVVFPISVVPPINMCPDQLVMRIAPLVASVRRLPQALSEFRVHGSNAYSSRKLSVESVQKELGIARSLWSAQYLYLSHLDQELARELLTLDHSSYTSLLEYMEAKLEGSSSVREIHGRYVMNSKRLDDVKLLLFWRMSIYLPNWLFKPAVRFVTGENALKRLFAWLKTARINRELPVVRS